MIILVIEVGVGFWSCLLNSSDKGIIQQLL